MSLGKRLFTEGAAACLTENVNPFTGTSSDNGKALYSLDFDASDTSGVYNGTPVDVDFGVSGKTLFGARFNGSTSYIDLPVNSALTKANDFSWSLWFNLRSTTLNDNQTLFANNSTSTARYFVMFNNSTLGSIRFNGNGGGNHHSAAGLVTAGTWFHLAVSKSSTAGLIVYLNGVAVITETGETGDYTNGTQANSKNVLGGYYVLNALQTSFALKGKIDQVRIFSKALSSSEVSTLYNSGNGETACVHTSTTDNNDFPVTNTAYYKLDNSAEDSKGTNDGTETDIEYRFGRYGQAAVFNGSSSKIEVSDPVIPVGATSLSFWFNNDNTAGSLSGGETHYILGSGVSSSSKGLTAGFFEQKFFAVVNNAASSSSLTGTTLFSKTNWHHCVVTWDGTTGSNKLKIYVNGNLEIQGTSSIAASTISSYTNFAIGGTLSSGFIGGRVDQVRIFSTALSSSQVTELYNEKPETDTSDFKTVLYEGTGATQYISNVGMDLETSGGLVWIKNRDVSDHHVLFDSVRGATKYIMSSFPNSQESTDSATLTSFEKNGFFLGADGTTGGAANGNNESLVAWVWKGGGAAVSNGNGSITSSVSANTAAGFSIVSWTGNGTGATIGHGLSAKPELILIKARTRTNNWGVYAEAITAENFLVLNSTAAQGDSSTAFNDTEPTSSVFTVGSSLSFNNSGTMIAYCFHSVSGYSKIGTYDGTGSSVNNRIYTTDDGNSTGSNGFKPSWILIKNADGSYGWGIIDNRRLASDGDVRTLFANSNGVEADISGNIIFNDDGFTIQNYGAGWANLSNGDTYLYYAIK